MYATTTQAAFRDMDQALPVKGHAFHIIVSLIFFAYEFSTSVGTKKVPLRTEGLLLKRATKN
jgi:hypothetical protein